jgi:hypothetical protein
MNATFLHKEHGRVTPLYSILGYAASTYTGISRSLNNRHWLSDILAGAGINLSKLESRPMRGELWKYLFFADLDCDITAGENAPALRAMRECCLRVRVLGVYPAARRLPAR